MIEMIAFNYRKNKTIHWRVFFDHTFDLLNQILLGFIRFYNSSRMPYLRFFLPIRYHQKAIWLSIRSQRRQRRGKIKILFKQTLASFLYWELVFCVFKKIDLLEYLKDYFCYTGTVFNERLK